MNVKNWLTLNAIVSILFGLGFVLAPGTVYDIYGISMDDNLVYTSQLFGAALVGFAVISWMARNASDTTARQAIVVGLFAGEILGFLMALIGQFRDSAVSMGWLNVALYLILGLGFGYLAFVKSD